MATSKSTQSEKAIQLHQLHHSGKLLILPNIWDVLGAKLLEDLGYEAVATASAAVAYSNGYNDGENIPFTEVLHILTRIAGSVHVPVTADIESGFADSDIELIKNIHKLIETGIVGINIEDTDKRTKALLPLDVQSKKIKLIKEASLEKNVPLFINARTDTYIHETNFASKQEQLEETIKRGKAYKDAGAGCFYPILLHDEQHIKTIVEAVKIPVNILMMPGIPELSALQQMGVTRVSLGPGLFKYAVKAMQELAIKLQRNEGLADVAGNTVTSEYLKHLVQS